MLPTRCAIIFSLGAAQKAIQIVADVAMSCQACQDALPVTKETSHFVLLRRSQHNINTDFVPRVLLAYSRQFSAVVNGKSKNDLLEDQLLMTFIRPARKPRANFLMKEDL